MRREDPQNAAVPNWTRLKNLLLDLRDLTRRWDAEYGATGVYPLGDAAVWLLLLTSFPVSIIACFYWLKAYDEFSKVVAVVALVLLWSLVVASWKVRSDARFERAMRTRRRR
jgi:hypothetical protein